MITVHPWLSGRAGRLAMLEDLLGHIKSQDDVWHATAAEIAEWHHTSANAARFSYASDLATLATHLPTENRP
jgi:hypothetical protein